MLNVAILPNFHVLLIQMQRWMDQPFATYYWKTLLLMPFPFLSLSLTLLSVIGLQKKESTSIPICSYSFSSILIFRYSVDTLAPFYMHCSELEEVLKRLSIRSHTLGAHCRFMRYHHLSFLQCHSRVKELCIVFSQLLHLHVMVTSTPLAICLFKKSMCSDCKIPTLLSSEILCLVTCISSTPVSRRSSRQGSPIFLDNCVR